MPESEYDVRAKVLFEENERLKSELKKRSEELSAVRQAFKKNSEGALKKQKERFLRVIQSMRDALCVLDDAGTITFANPVAEELLGSKCLLGENFFDFFNVSGDQSKHNEHCDSFSHGTTKSMVGQIVCKNGVRIPIRSSWSTLCEETGVEIGKVVVFNDYSIDLEIQRRLEQARDRAVEMSKLKSEFLATMSHEIRTPLNGIISLVSLLEMSDLNEEQKEDVSDLKASSGQLQEIITNILDLSKIEAGKMYLDYQKFSPTHLMKDVKKLFSGQLEEKNITFISEVIGDLPPYVSADYTRLKQVLVNLIGNSIKFTPSEGFIILMVRSKNIGNSYFEIEFSVIDTGVGIAESALNRLFTPFIQADGSITRNFGGTGLGLSICKSLVDLMGSNITVKSREGMGSAFSFKLHLEEPMFSQDSLERLKTISNEPCKSKDRSATVLIVDDNQINLSTTSRFLKKYGLNILSASSGDEALALTAKEQVDIMLLDLHMPSMSGYEVTRCVRESNSSKASMPILALTADVLESTKQACLDVGFTGVVTKPISLFELVQKIDDILGYKILKQDLMNTEQT